MPDRKWVILAAVLGIVSCLLSPGAAAAEREPAPDASYLEALRVADLFLTAWAQRQPDAGLALMSAALLARGAPGPSISDSSRIDPRAGLLQYMSGPSNPHHEAFEIAPGRPAGLDRFAFPVRLFEVYLGAPSGLAYSDTLGVIRELGEWRVNRLPRAWEPD